MIKYLLRLRLFVLYYLSFFLFYLNLLQTIVLKWYSPYLDHIEPTDQLKDPKSRLQEYLQARKKPLPVYEVVDIQGDAPNQHFKVECTVEGLPLNTVKVQAVALLNRQ